MFLWFLSAAVTVWTVKIWRCCFSHTGCISVAIFKLFTAKALIKRDIRLCFHPKSLIKLPHCFFSLTENSFVCFITLECAKAQTDKTPRWEQANDQNLCINEHWQMWSEFVSYPQRGALPVVTSKVQDALCCHGEACVLRETWHPVLMFVQIFLKKDTSSTVFKKCKLYYMF